MAAIGQSRPTAPPGVRPPASSGVRTPLFVLGVALSLGAFLVMFAFGLIYAGRIQTPGQTTVVAASMEIAPKTPIDPSMVKLVSIPNSALPPNVFLRTRDLVGDYAIVTIYPGEPISGNLVASNPDLLNQTSYLPIPSGFVAMTLKADEVKEVGGYPAQGDYIDVIASVPLRLFNPTDSRTVDVIVFTNLYIIRVGPQSTVARQGQPQGVASSITVVLSPCDAVFLQWLQDNTQLTYLLISYKDYQRPPSPGASPSPPPSPSASSTPKAACPASVGSAQADGRWRFTGP